MKKSSIWKKLLMVLGALVAVVAIVVASVYGTVAYLSSSALIQNSFTVGQVGITMTESPVDADGHKSETPVPLDQRVTQNKYTLVSGASYDKDPTIYVDSTSQDSYLFIIVRNDLSATKFHAPVAGEIYGEVELSGNTIEANTDEKETLLDQILANGWRPIASVATGNVYVYAGYQTDENGNIKTFEGEKLINEDPTHVSADDVIPVFSKLHIDKKVNDFHQYATAQINVRAFAIQDIGFANITEAWNALVEEYSTVIVGANPST